MKFQGKNVLVGISGSIAAYKVAQWVHDLAAEEAHVTVVMTEAATRFIAPLTFSALSGNHVHCQMFGVDEGPAMAHIALAQQADIILVAPATAQTIARCAHGMADDLLATVILAARCPVVFCPAMNTHMYEHVVTRKNLLRLQSIGYVVVDPECGVLACGEQGAGRLASWDSAREQMLACLTTQDLAGKQVLITAGPTREAMDPVRYLTNRSSGKMGYALARTAQRRGAKVTLVSGPVALPAPPGMHLIPVDSARDMEEIVLRESAGMDIVVKAAAVADYRPTTCSTHKIKKSGDNLQLALEPTTDILFQLGRQKTKKMFLVGFAAESDDHLQAGAAKLAQKNLDLVVINDILGKDTGFDVDSNQVTLLYAGGSDTLPVLSKEDTADSIWDKVLQLQLGKTGGTVKQDAL